MKNNLFKASIKELQFANLQIEYLLSIIDEIYVLSNDKLIKSIIRNWKKRYNLDKLCHIRTLFGINPNWLNK